MKQPTVIINGTEHKVLSVNWFKHGSVCHIAIHLNGETECFFHPGAQGGKWYTVNDHGDYTYHDVQFKEEVK